MILLIHGDLLLMMDYKLVYTPLKSKSGTKAVEEVPLS